MSCLIEKREQNCALLVYNEFIEPCVLKPNIESIPLWFVTVVKTLKNSEAAFPLPDVHAPY